MQISTNPFFLIEKKTKAYALCMLNIVMSMCKEIITIYRQVLTVLKLKDNLHFMLLLLPLTTGVGQMLIPLLEFQIIQLDQHQISKKKIKRKWAPNCY